LRGKQNDSLFACIFVDKIEQFIEGYNKDDYLISVDMCKSFRLASNPTTFPQWYTESVRSFGIGLAEIDNRIIGELQKKVADCIEYSFAQPPSLILRDIQIPNIRNATEIQARWVMSSIISRLSLSDVWATKSPALIPPFANFAFNNVKYKHGLDLAKQIGDFLVKTDPSSFNKNGLQQPSCQKTESHIGRLTEPSIDVGLVSIMPDKIFARKFIAGVDKVIDYREIFAKTETAENKHQDILRDLSNYLVSMKYVPMQSSSIDLAIVKNGSIFVFEIKTTNDENVFRQISKGLFQVLCYKQALLNSGYSSVKNGIIITKPINEKIIEYVRGILTSVDICLSVYDEERSWPNKIPEFVEILNSTENTMDHKNG
jgi:hypothetical protein